MPQVTSATDSYGIPGDTSTPIPSTSRLRIESQTLSENALDTSFLRSLDAKTVKDILNAGDAKLSDSQIAGLLADPGLSLSEWVTRSNTGAHAKVSSGLKYFGQRSALDRLLFKPKEFAIRLEARRGSAKGGDLGRSIKSDLSYEKDKARISQRSYKDFLLLRNRLVLNFPFAFVPNVPKEKTKSSMNIFLDFILNNPFFRNDYSVKLFIDALCVNYSKAMKKQMKSTTTPSEGSLRWIQALTSYTPTTSIWYSANKTKLSVLRAELKSSLDLLKKLKSSVLKMMGSLEAEAKCYSDIQGCFETALINEGRFKCLSSTNEELPNSLGNGIQTCSKQSALLKSEYGSPVLQKTVLNPILHETSVVQLWLKHLDVFEQKSRNFESSVLKTLSPQEVIKFKRDPFSFQGLNSSDMAMKLQLQESELSSMTKGLFGIELDIYKHLRGSRLKRIQKNLAAFHIRGSEKVFDTWGSCLSTAERRRHALKRHELDEFDFNELSLKQKRESNMGVDMFNSDSVLPMLIQAKGDLKKLKGGQLKKLGVKKNEMLKIVPGEYIVGYDTSNRRKSVVSGDLIAAVNSNGKRGYVHNANIGSVLATSSSSSHRNSLVLGENEGAVFDNTSGFNEINKSEDVKESRELELAVDDDEKRNVYFGSQQSFESALEMSGEVSQETKYMVSGESELRKSRISRSDTISTTGNKKRYDFSGIMRSAVDNVYSQPWESETGNEVLKKEASARVQGTLREEKKMASLDSSSKSQSLLDSKQEIVEREQEVSGGRVLESSSQKKAIDVASENQPPPLPAKIPILKGSPTPPSKVSLQTQANNLRPPVSFLGELNGFNKTNLKSAGAAPRLQNAAKKVVAQDRGISLLDELKKATENSGKVLRHVDMAAIAEEKKKREPIAVGTGGLLLAELRHKMILRRQHLAPEDEE